MTASRTASKHFRTQEHGASTLVILIQLYTDLPKTVQVTAWSELMTPGLSLPYRLTVLADSSSGVYIYERQHAGRFFQRSFHAPLMMSCGRAVDMARPTYPQLPWGQMAPHWNDLLPRLHNNKGINIYLRGLKCVFKTAQKNGCD